MRRSLRYSPAQAQRPPSTGSSKVKMRLVTPPVDVITTTMSTRGCSSSTSTWRTVAVSTGGALTMASRLVTCESVSEVDAHRLVDLAADEAQVQRAVRDRRGQQAIDVEAVPSVGRHAPRARVRMGEQALLLEHAELVADGRRAAVDLGVGGKGLGPDRQRGRGVQLDELAEDQLLAGREHRPTDSRPGGCG